MLDRLMRARPAKAGASYGAPGSLWGSGLRKPQHYFRTPRKGPW